MSLEDLRNVKTASISEWVSQEAPRRAVKREFKNFLQTYVDEHGTSVYGERIRDMGERKSGLIYKTNGHCIDNYGS